MILNIDRLLRILKHTVISCLSVMVCAVTSSANLQAQTSASSIVPVLSLLLLDGSVNMSADAIKIATGGGHSCARLIDGAVKCWGSNGSGQLGDGTTINRLTPVPVSF